MLGAFFILIYSMLIPKGGAELSEQLRCLYSPHCSKGGSIEVGDGVTVTRPELTWMEHRLSGDQIPSRYLVRLQAEVRGWNGATESSIQGSVTIHFSNRVPTDCVELHSQELNITGAAIYHNSTIDPIAEIVNFSENPWKETIQFSLNTTLAGATDYMIQLNYSLAVTLGLRGLFEIWYRLGDNQVFSLTSHNEPTDLRKWLPSFDEPHLKATFSLSLDHPCELTAYSNGRATFSKMHRGQKVCHTVFEESPRMSPYLFSIAINDFMVVEGKTGCGFPLRAIYPPDVPAEKAAKAMQHIINGTELLLKEFPKDKLMTPKLDFLFVAGFSVGAMENAGLIICRLEVMESLQVIVHELNHQFFGNLVTAQWWSDVWINEALTRLYEDVVMHVDEKNFSQQLFHEGLYRDGLYSMGALHDPYARTSMESRNAFKSGVGYCKASNVMLMIRNHMGRERWDVAIKNYLNEHAYSVANHATLVDYFEREAGHLTPGFRELLMGWIEQPGHPAIFVRRFEDYAELTQTRFLESYADPDFRDKMTRWHVPFQFSVNGVLHSTVLHRDVEKAVIYLPPNAVFIVDPRNIGQFRVLYDAASYQSFRSVPIGDKSLFKAERDAYIGARFGYLRPRLAFAWLISKEYSDIDGIVTTGERIPMRYSLMGLAKGDDASLEMLTLKEKLQKAVRNHRLQREGVEIPPEEPDPFDEMFNQRSKRDADRSRLETEECRLPAHLNEVSARKAIYSLLDPTDSTCHKIELARIFYRIAQNGSLTGLLHQIITLELPKMVESEAKFAAVMGDFFANAFAGGGRAALTEFVKVHPRVATRLWFHVASLIEIGELERIDRFFNHPTIVKELRQLLNNVKEEVAMFD